MPRQRYGKVSNRVYAVLLFWYFFKKLCHLLNINNNFAKKIVEFLPFASARASWPEGASAESSAVALAEAPSD
jgi:hypothetical protein